MAEKRWMIYGASGYTGNLIAREAKMRGMNPVLAGRSHAKISALAKELELQFVVFELQDGKMLREQLSDCFLVLHCAGPFSSTAAPMIDACLDTGTHYYDITGEIDVFEYAHQRSDKAVESGVVLCPGVGFDVIPTDCLAANLIAKLPDAQELSLGFDSRGAMSAGTAKSSVEGIRLGCRVRKAGTIQRVPFGYMGREIDFGNGSKVASVIPWGDVSTAYYTTAIPNIRVYIPQRRGFMSQPFMLNLLGWLIRLPGLESYLKGKIEKNTTGPDSSFRQKERVYVWGEAINASGETIVARMQTANGYEMTVTGSLAMVAHLLSNTPPGAAYTPSRLMGPGFAETLPGSSQILFEEPTDATVHV